MNELLNTRELQQRIALYEDMDAYHALYDHYFNNLHYFCISFIKSHKVAEEIVSDVIVSKVIRYSFYKLARSFQIQAVKCPAR